MRDFTDEILIDRDFSGEDLRSANFTRASFQHSNLTNTQLTEACFQDADLSESRGLRAYQLRGCDLTGAKLPAEIAKFEGLAVAAEASKNASAIFLAFLAACTYCLLTIASISDAALFTPTITSQLPIIGVPIPLATFYYTAPPLLIGIFLYFHFSLQMVWEALASLPAVFPDGRPLHERAYPWLLNLSVRKQFLDAKSKTEIFRTLQLGLARLCAYWFLPITLVAFWWGGIKREDWWLTGTHLSLILLSLLAVIIFKRFALQTLQGVPVDFRWSLRAKLHKYFFVPFTEALVPTLLLFAVSLSVVSSITVPVISPLLARASLNPYANLSNASLSSKPAGWNGSDISQVQGADLHGRNLRHIKAERAFLVNADLQKADLRDMDLTLADLRGAKFDIESRLGGVNFFRSDLRDANLQGVSFAGAVMQFANLQNATWDNRDVISDHGRLEGNQTLQDQLSDTYNWVLSKMSEPERLGLPDNHVARLESRNLSGYDFGKAMADVNLQDADLREFNLSGSNLSGINFRQANLERANFDGADVSDANFESADLKGADLSRAKGLTLDQIAVAWTDPTTKLPGSLVKDHPGATLKR